MGGGGGGSIKYVDQVSQYEPVSNRYHGYLKMAVIFVISILSFVCIYLIVICGLLLLLTLVVVFMDL